MWKITLAAWLYMTGHDPVAIAPREMPDLATCWKEAAAMQDDFWAAQGDTPNIDHMQLDVSCIKEWYGGKPL